MKGECLKPEEIAIAWHADVGPQSQHLRQCSWCQALAQSLNLFQRDGGLPAGANPAAAERHLAEFLQRELVGVAESPDILPPPVGSAGRRRSGRLWWAAAAVLVVLAGMPRFLDRSPELSRDTVLRGEVATGRNALRLSAPEVQVGGDVLISWQPLENATAYDVLLLDGEQSEAGRIAAGAATSHSLTRAELELLAARPHPWFVQIIARRKGDEISRSLPRLLPDGAGEDR